MERFLCIAKRCFKNDDAELRPVDQEEYCPDNEGNRIARNALVGMNIAMGSVLATLFFLIGKVRVDGDKTEVMRNMSNGLKSGLLMIMIVCVISVTSGFLWYICSPKVQGWIIRGIQLISVLEAGAMFLPMLEFISYSLDFTLLPYLLGVSIVSATVLLLSKYSSSDTIHHEETTQPWLLQDSFAASFFFLEIFLLVTYFAGGKMSGMLEGMLYLNTGILVLVALIWLYERRKKKKRTSISGIFVFLMKTMMYLVAACLIFFRFFELLPYFIFILLFFSTMSIHMFLPILKKFLLSLISQVKEIILSAVESLFGKCFKKCLKKLFSKGCFKKYLRGCSKKCPKGCSGRWFWSLLRLLFRMLPILARLLSIVSMAIPLIGIIAMVVTLLPLLYEAGMELADLIKPYISEESTETIREVVKRFTTYQP
jgi:hypothetical protein